MKTSFAAALLAASSLCLAMPSAQANLIKNGGFETGDFSDWVQSGSLESTGVSISRCAHSGDYCVYFNSPVSDRPNILTQTFATQIGQSYTLAYWLTEQFDGELSSFSASINNWETTLGDFGNGIVEDWTEESYSFVATATATTLGFKAFNQASSWRLDDVSVDASAVPEPGTLALLALGAAFLRTSRRARKVA